MDIRWCFSIRKRIKGANNMLEGDAGIVTALDLATCFDFFSHPYFSALFIFLYNMKAGEKWKIKKKSLKSILNSDTGIHSSTLFPFFFSFWFFFVVLLFFQEKKTGLLFFFPL